MSSSALQQPRLVQHDDRTLTTPTKHTRSHQSPRQKGTQQQPPKSKIHTIQTAVAVIIPTIPDPRPLSVSRTPAASSLQSKANTTTPILSASLQPAQRSPEQLSKSLCSSDTQQLYHAPRPATSYHEASVFARVRLPGPNTWSISKHGQLAESDTSSPQRPRYHDINPQHQEGKGQWIFTAEHLHAISIPTSSCAGYVTNTANCATRGWSKDCHEGEL
ncbi:hypothetical protein BKA64DRAFT_688868 [Cadophora sp. MPI-SDFR-AT-0126]|nr:hypothetical protein BKA64DRAFT_688868 [Leotiomycetes sp. MPI-SDFR-AT-0126]